MLFLLAFYSIDHHDSEVSTIRKFNLSCNHPSFIACNVNVRLKSLSLYSK